MDPIPDDVANDPLMNDVRAAGYAFWFKRRDGKPYLDLRATHGSDMAGIATFHMLDGSKQIQVETIHTVESHRRRGVATAFYVVAQRLTGFSVKAAVNQTDEGRLLWAQENRPW